MPTPYLDEFHALARTLSQSKGRQGLSNELRRPLRVLRDIWWSRKTFEMGASNVPGTRRSKLILQFWKLSARYGYSVDEYFRYRMHLLPAEQAAMFVPLASNILTRTFLYEKLSLDPAPLADKRVFYRACKAAGLPVPDTVADVQDGEVRWWETQSLPPCDLFAKEAASLCGAGAVRWDYQGGGTWRGSDGSYDESGLLEKLRALSRVAPVVVQRLVENHPDIAGLGTSGLCTVRVVTLAEPPGERARVFLTAFRMPADSGIVDNFARGGLACGVDARTGQLGHAVRKKISLVHLDLDRHPNTGAPISGSRLPLWEEVISLALKSHAIFHQYPSVGWDIAITPDGPLLIEGNYNWDVVLSQQAGLRPLGATEFPRHYFSWLRAAETGRAPEGNKEKWGLAEQTSQV